MATSLTPQQKQDQLDSDLNLLHEFLHSSNISVETEGGTMSTLSFLVSRTNAQLLELTSSNLTPPLAFMANLVQLYPTPVSMPTNQDFEVLIESNDVTYTEAQGFILNTPGIYEIQASGSVTPFNENGDSVEWELGNQTLTILLDAGGNEAIPLYDNERNITYLVDSNNSLKPAGFTEKFYLNVLPTSSKDISVRLSSTLYGTPGTAYSKTKMALTIKRIQQASNLPPDVTPDPVPPTVTTYQLGAPYDGPVTDYPNPDAAIEAFILFAAASTTLEPFQTYLLNNPESTFNVYRSSVSFPDAGGVSTVVCQVYVEGSALYIGDITTTITEITTPAP